MQVLQNLGFALTLTQGPLRQTESLQLDVAHAFLGISIGTEAVHIQVVEGHADGA